MAIGRYSKVLAACFATMMIAPSVSADTGWQFEKARVGHVYSDSLQSSCGGSLIGADLVITAAHCVVREMSSDPVMPSDVSFSIRDESGEVVIYAVKDIATDPEFFRDKTPTTKFISHDVALLRLTDFVDGPFDSLAPLDKTQEYIALLPAGEGDEFLAEPCKVDYEKNDVLVLPCTRASGASGSPAYSLIDGERKLVAVVSASGVKNDQPITFAVGAMGLLANMKWVSVDRAIPTNYQ